MTLDVYHGRKTTIQYNTIQGLILYLSNNFILSTPLGYMLMFFLIFNNEVHHFASVKYNRLEKQL